MGGVGTAPPLPAADPEESNGTQLESPAAPIQAEVPYEPQRSWSWSPPAEEPLPPAQHWLPEEPERAPEPPAPDPHPHAESAAAPEQQPPEAAASAPATGAPGDLAAEFEPVGAVEPGTHVTLGDWTEVAWHRVGQDEPAGGPSGPVAEPAPAPAATAAAAEDADVLETLTQRPQPESTGFVAVVEPLVEEAPAEASTPEPPPAEAPLVEEPPTPEPPRVEEPPTPEPPAAREFPSDDRPEERASARGRTAAPRRERAPSQRGRSQRAPSHGERGRMRRRARYLRALREIQLRDIGGFALELHRYGQQRPDLLAAKIAGAAMTDSELRALEQALDEGSSMRELREAGIGGACDNCGAVHGSTDRYCATCGEALDMSRFEDEDDDAADER
jgi:hypothetical protein